MILKSTQENTEKIKDNMFCKYLFFVQYLFLNKHIHLMLFIFFSKTYIIYINERLPTNILHTRI